MLSITRKLSQSFMIGDNISVTVTRIEHGQVRLRIEAPREIPIHRQEIYENIQAEKEADRLIDNRIG